MSSFIKRNCGSCEYYEPNAVNYSSGQCFAAHLDLSEQRQLGVDESCEFWIQRSEDE